MWDGEQGQEAGQFLLGDTERRCQSGERVGRRIADTPLVVAHSLYGTVAARCELTLGQPESQAELAKVAAEDGPGPKGWPGEASLQELRVEVEDRGESFDEPGERSFWRGDDPPPRSW